LRTILSPREKRLLRRFAQGKSDKTIAQEMGGTAKQVAAARAMLTNKLGICSQEHLVSVASLLAPWAFADQAMIACQLRRAAGSF
jgi:DNA-binding CsgD family transcriptional regulator